jgi:hypothetical protein
MQCFADDLVRDVRAVEVGGVDMIDSGVDSFAEHGDGLVAIARRTEDAFAGELHGAVAHAVHGEGCAGKGEGATEIRSAVDCGGRRIGHG